MTNLTHDLMEIFRPMSQEEKDRILSEPPNPNHDPALGSVMQTLTELIERMRKIEKEAELARSDLQDTYDFIFDEYFAGRSK